MGPLPQLLTRLLRGRPCRRGVCGQQGGRAPHFFRFPVSLTMAYSKPYEETTLFSPPPSPELASSWVARYNSYLLPTDQHIYNSGSVIAPDNLPVHICKRQKLIFQYSSHAEAHSISSPRNFSAHLQFPLTYSPPLVPYSHDHSSAAALLQPTQRLIPPPTRLSYKPTMLRQSNEMHLA